MAAAAQPASTSWREPRLGRPHEAFDLDHDAASRAASLRSRQSCTDGGASPAAASASRRPLRLISAAASITNRLRSRAGLLLRHPADGERLDRLAARRCRAHQRASRATTRGWPSSSRRGTATRARRSSSLRQRQDADRGGAVDDRAQHLRGRVVGGRSASGRRNDRAPDPSSRGRCRRANTATANGPCRRSGRRQQLAPHPHQRRPRAASRDGARPGGAGSTASRAGRQEAVGSRRSAVALSADRSATTPASHQQIVQMASSIPSIWRRRSSMRSWRRGHDAGRCV